MELNEFYTKEKGEEMKTSLEDIKQLIEWMLICATTTMTGGESSILCKNEYPEMIWEMAKYIAKTQII